ncbi:MAG: VOC family protein [Acidobacteriaceae bacterium]|jgi:catechol 2,3-dioxygenase-like lactoylglutathione lyase family enzyme
MATLQQEVRSEDASVASAVKVDMKVEVLVLPVSDVDRAKQFYVKLGWRLDVTPPIVVQLTPPGSWCSVQFGKTLTTAAPGSAKAYVVVSDIVAARNELLAAGVEVGEFFHIGPQGRLSGLDPERRTYGSRASFSDPDGNVWVLQEVTTRLPGRVDSGLTSFSSASDLASALRRASAAHDQHEKRIGAADPNWPDWYAEYMVREQNGEELPQ